MRVIPKGMLAGLAAATVLSLLAVLMPMAGAGLFGMTMGVMALIVSLIWLARQDLAERMKQA
jgi:presenilin-like A22 family membrane protease